MTDRTYQQPRLTFDQQDEAVAMLCAGKTTREVAAHFGCSTYTISRIRDRRENFSKGYCKSPYVGDFSYLAERESYEPTPAEREGIERRIMEAKLRRTEGRI